MPKTETTEQESLRQTVDRVLSKLSWMCTPESCRRLAKQESAEATLLRWLGEIRSDLQLATDLEDAQAEIDRSSGRAAAMDELIKSYDRGLIEHPRCACLLQHFDQSPPEGEVFPARMIRVDPSLPSNVCELRTGRTVIRFELPEDPSNEHE